MATAPVEQRLWAKVEKREPNECWLWRGAQDDHGYGRIYYNGVNQKATRVMWQVARGATIPPRMLVCHSCDNPQCVNPDHLWLGTSQDNMLDASAKRRLPGCKVTHCPRGHEYTPENTSLGNGRQCRTCARDRERRRREAAKQGDAL